MTDIVEKLRLVASSGSPDGPYSAPLTEAADEIERLRTLLGLAADELYCASESLEYLNRPLWSRRYAKVSEKIKEAIK